MNTSRNSISRLVAAAVVGVALAGATGPVAAPGTSAVLEEEFATLAMLEDTRCPEGIRIAAYLDNPVPEVRRRAALALARLQDSTTVDQLAHRLRTDEDVEVRRLAAFALGQIGHADGLTALETAYESDQDRDVRELAIEATGKVAKVRGAAICVRALADADAGIRHQAGIALWRIGDEGASRQLLKALEDPDPDVRWAVIYALEKIEDPAQVLPGVGPLAGDPSPRVRAYVARTLGRMKDPRALPLIFPLLEDEDLAVRVNACRAIAAIGDSSAAPQLLARLEDLHPYVRETAAAALGEIGEEVAAIRLGQVAKDPVDAVRAACGVAMVKLLPPESAELVALPMLEDSSEYVRALVSGALGAVNTPEVVAALRQIAGGTNLLGESVGGRERAAAVSALGELGAADARGELLAALTDDRVAVVATAAEALAAIGAGDATATEAVMDAVRRNPSPNEPDIAVSGLTALGEMKATAAEPLATELLTSSQPQIREAAEACLTAVVGAERAAELASEHRPPPWQAQPVRPYRTPPPGARRAVVRTERGDITLQLFSAEAPRTVANFARLAEEGYFDGTRFHRVVPNFVIQDGDPTGTGWGGPGYAIRCEYNRKRYETGTVGMALAGKDTGGSQWFITHAPQPHLNGRYTVFAQVVEGLEILYQIEVGDRIATIDIER